MFNEPGRGIAGPWGCPYCGTSFNAPLIICPQCGAKQQAARHRVAPVSEYAAYEPPNAQGIGDGFAQEKHAQWRPGAFSFGGAEAFSGAADVFDGTQRYSDYPSQDESRVGQRSWTPFYAIGTVVSVSFLVAAYLISHRVEREPTPGVQVVEGAVLGPKVDAAKPPPPTTHHAPVLAAQAPARVPVTPPAPMVAHVPSAPAQVPQPPRHATPVPTVTAQTTHAPTAQQIAADRKSAAEQRAFAAKASANARAADVSRNLASARTSLDKNNLGPARRSLTAALAAQPGNGAALQMQSELASREQERDSLLGYARLCARQEQWLCAWHNAGHALTVDASSSDARELLSRSIAAQGAAGPARRVYGGPPGPPIDDQ
ncbi:hypothetical protein C7401_113209 [Paraburkholderia unamae]|nr:hypothetical protein C7401_113209 [Paraburkholderia unamae]